MAKSSLEPTGGAHGVQTWHKAKATPQPALQQNPRNRITRTRGFLKMDPFSEKSTPWSSQSAAHLLQSPLPPYTFQTTLTYIIPMCTPEPEVCLPKHSTLKGRPLTRFCSVAALRLPPFTRPTAAHVREHHRTLPYLPHSPPLSAPNTRPQPQPFNTTTTITSFL